MFYSDFPSKSELEIWMRFIWPSWLQSNSSDIQIIFNCLTEKRHKLKITGNDVVSHHWSLSLLSVFSLLNSLIWLKRFKLFNLRIFEIHRRILRHKVLFWKADFLLQQKFHSNDIIHEPQFSGSWKCFLYGLTADVQDCESLLIVGMFLSD